MNFLTCARMLGACVVMTALGWLYPAEAVVIGIADDNDKKAKAVARVTLFEKDRVKRIMLKYHLKAPFLTPREGLSAEQQKEALDEAKKLILSLSKEYKVYEKKMQTDANAYALMNHVSVAVKASAEVLAVFGSVEDAKWLAKHMVYYQSGDYIAQILARHGVAFSELKDLGEARWYVGIACAKAGDKGALEWLVKEAATNPKRSAYQILYIQVHQRHLGAKAQAEKVIDAYQKELAAGKHPKQIYSFYNAVPWAIIQIILDDNKPYLKKIEGMLVSEWVASRPEMCLVILDPRPVFDMIFGAKGKIANHEIYRFKRMDWAADQLRASIKGRAAADGALVLKHYRNLVFRAAMKHNVFGGNSRATTILMDHIIDSNLSAIRTSSTAANLVNAYADSERTEFRFRTTPWIKMDWLPNQQAPTLMNIKHQINLDGRLSPFTYETVKTAFDKQKNAHLGSKQAFLLNHRCLNKNFLTPQASQLGAVHAPVVRLTGEISGVGVHSIIQVITPKTKGKLTVGFKLKSVHHDGGGLASRINQTHLKLAELHKDSCRVQVTNVRYASPSGNSGKLTFLRTTKGGVHIYQCKLPDAGVNDLTLYYDWTLFENKYSLAHSLNEPWFALTK